MDSTTIERYDRQIRLWGEHGQSKCSSARVCLINADSLGVEILKGLGLAGISTVFIMDSHRLTPQDVGCSFLPHSAVGKNRGNAAKAMLSEINDEITCEVHPVESHLPLVSPQQTDEHMTNTTNENCDTNFWKKFNCVICSGILHLSQIKTLSRICWDNHIPLIQCRSIGFSGYIRCQVNEHTVIDTHPEWRPPNHDPNKPDTALITSNPIFEDYDSRTCNFCEEDEEEAHTMTEYIGLKALDIFFSTFSRLPGQNPEQIETDSSKLKECAKRMIARSISLFKNLEESLYEFCRYGGSELHVTSAFMGGCVTQEAIKMVTGQYVPLVDCLVYSAAGSKTRAFRRDRIFT